MILDSTMVASRNETPRIIDVHREVPSAIETRPMNASAEDKNRPVSDKCNKLWEI
jgi:hypothetical protein